MIARVVPATDAHVPTIRAIYNEAIRTLSATFDTVEKSLADRQRWLVERTPAHPVFVALDAHEAVLGWGALSPFSDRPAWSRTVENAVYVATDQRGAGVGTALLAQLLDAARAQHHHAVIARIVGGNAASIRLHERFGFVVAGTLREVGWKFDRWHDVVLMQALIADDG